MKTHHGEVQKEPLRDESVEVLVSDEKERGEHSGVSVRDLPLAHVGHHQPVGDLGRHQPEHQHV